jgi:hypothetical protein
MWLMVLDKNINLQDGVKNTIYANTKRKELQQNAKQRYPNKNSSIKESTLLKELAYQSITSEESLKYDVFAPYLRNVDELLTKNNTMTNSNNSNYDNEDDVFNRILNQPVKEISICDIAKYLTVEKSFSLHVDSVIDAQKDVAQYFNTIDGMTSASAFKGFPFPEKTFRFTPEYFNPHQNL